MGDNLIQYFFRIVPRVLVFPSHCNVLGVEKACADEDGTSLLVLYQSVKKIEHQGDMLDQKFESFAILIP